MLLGFPGKGLMETGCQAPSFTLYFLHNRDTQDGAVEVPMKKECKEINKGGA